MSNSFFRIVILTAVTICPAWRAVGQSHPSPLDIAVQHVSSLSQQDRFSFLIDQLKIREQQFEHMSIAFTESVAEMQTAAARADAKVPDVIDNDVTWDGENIFIKRQERKGEARLVETVICYDNDERRSLSHTFDGEIPLAGIITKDPAHSLLNSPFYHLLGTRVNNGYRIHDGKVVQASLPISESLTVNALPWKIDVVGTSQEASVIATFQRQEGDVYYNYVWTFDLARGCLPVRYEDNSVIGATAMQLIYEVTSVRDVDGFFVPGSINYSTLTTGLEGTSGGSWSATVIAVTKSSGISDHDLSFPFPPGTIVLDETTGVAYRCSSDGNTDPVPLEDGCTLIERQTAIQSN